MRILSWVLLALLMDFALGQPATVTLRAKLRDFKDYIATDPSTHPDFENDAFMGCGGENLGYVRNTLALDGLVDTSLFRGDNRDPVLLSLNHPTTTKPCFTSLNHFKAWYNDNPSVNRSFYTDLVLTRNTQGVYTFTDDNFLPLNPTANWKKFRPTDPNPFGPRPEINPTDVWGFTMELHTVFTYTAGKGQVFSFTGDDDVWVFINDRLAIDLGGLHSSMSSTIDLDKQATALGLVDGGNYPLDFFFAERHSTGSRCQISTSLELLQKSPLPAPEATPKGTGFQNSIQVSLIVPGHPDAQIRYTLDGSEPTETSPLYAGALTIAATTTLKAKGFKVDYNESPTLTEVYTRVLLALPTPIANPAGSTFYDSLRVTLSVEGHADAQIRYTVDGSEPTPLSSLYSGSLKLTATTQLKAKAFKTDFLPSATLSETYTRALRPLPSPQADPPGQTFQDTLRIRLTVAGVPEAQIRYTLDGSEPTTASPLYNGSILLSRNATIKALATLPGWLPSAVTTETYVLIVPPNVISLKIERPISQTATLNSILSLPDLKRPIALVSVQGGITRCLACPAGSESWVLTPGQFPEWVTLSRDPFHYRFQIFDNLGVFVLSQSGEVTRDMLNQAPSDSAGYRAFRFRWIPVASNGRLIGTGAYILRAEVLSQSTTSTGAVVGMPSRSNLFKTFGFVRQD